MKTDIPQVMEVTKAVHEGKGQYSFFFKGSIKSKPGQFIMVWLPEVDEKPMAVAYHEKNEFAFTSQSVGTFTKALEHIKEGDKLGIRGPYGNGFTLKDDACVVAGGVGMSSVSTLIDALNNPLVIYGARSKEHLIYLDRYKDKDMRITTDDGSFGRKGFVTEVLEEVLQEGKIKVVYTCGPEVMMLKVFELCEKYGVECQASIERYMACGFGICGKCVMDDQIVCMDGPVFNSEMLRKMQEFGKFARLKSGKKVGLEEYHATHT